MAAIKDRGLVRCASEPFRGFSAYLRPQSMPSYPCPSTQLAQLNRGTARVSATLSHPTTSPLYASPTSTWADRLSTIGHQFNNPGVFLVDPVKKDFYPLSSAGSPQITSFSLLPAGHYSTSTFSLTDNETEVLIKKLTGETGERPHEKAAAPSPARAVSGNVPDSSPLS
jgi:hypothetical protein